MQIEYNFSCLKKLRMGQKISHKIAKSNKKQSDDSRNQLAEPTTTSSYDPDDNHFSQLTNEWLIKNKIGTDMNYSEIVEQAAIGLEKEGNLIGKNQEGNQLANMLREVKNCERKEIIARCVRIYTMETFIYTTLNKALSEFDMSKVDTFGPYCYFLNCYPEALGRNYFVGTVYRGIELNSENVEEYKKAVGQWKSWPRFISTSKNRDVVQHYKALCIIELTASARYGKAIDITHLSYFSAEDEVLMLPGSNFRVNRVEYLENDRSIFYLTVV